MWKRILFRKFLRKASISTEILHKMQRLSVRKVDGEERIQLSFIYGLKGKKARQYNLDRASNEELSRCLDRMTTNINGKISKKIKKKKGASVGGVEPENVTVELFDPNSHEKITDSAPVTDAFSTGAVLKIACFNEIEKYEVQVNPPCIRSVRLPDCIMPGFSVYPQIDGEFMDLEKSSFVWYKSCVNTPEANSVKGEDADAVSDEAPVKRPRSQSSSAEDEWERFCDTYSCTPTNADIGYKLKVVCTPSNGEIEGNSFETVSKYEVTSGPGFCPFENRHILTQRLIDQNSVRVVSYNVLADVYADSDYSRNMLYPYCPPYALAIDYRKNLIIKELLGYNADILCLQEMDSKLFALDLLPTLESSGFQGLLKVKSGDIREGTATFFRTSKFKLVDQHDITLLDELKNEDIHKELWEKICANEQMKELMLNRSTTMQVTVLQQVEDADRCVITATTHLYFHPRAGNVRMIQTHVCLKYLEKIQDLYKEKGIHPTILFTGDLNSTPKTGAIELITKGSVSSANADWFSGGKEQLLENIDLSHRFKLTSACGYPDYTNFVGSFYGCLDYIFIESEQFKVKQVIPLPSHEEVAAYTALPNPVFPSDHLALVCDLEWSQER